MVDLCGLDVTVIIFMIVLSLVVTLLVYYGITLKVFQNNSDNRESFEKAGSHMVSQFKSVFVKSELYRRTCFRDFYCAIWFAQD